MEFDPDVITSIEADRLQILPEYGDAYCIIESIVKCLQNVGDTLANGPKYSRMNQAKFVEDSL